jgi:hypothetical protein
MRLTSGCACAASLDTQSTSNANRETLNIHAARPAALRDSAQPEYPRSWHSTQKI